MLPLVISVVLFTFLMGAISMYGYRRYVRPGRVLEQVGTAVITAEMPLTDSGGIRVPGGLVRIIQKVGEKVPVTPSDVTTSRRYLLAAGYRSEGAVAIYYGIKVLLLAGFLVSMYFLRDFITVIPILRIVLMVAAGLVGYFGPNLVLDHLVDRRHEDLRLSLPDALDLMVVCVEAGLGLDQAINYVARELVITHKDLSEELELVNLEMRAGKRRAEAMRNLADRTGETEIRKLVAILIQTDRFGTSIADSLRTHSDFMRVRRRQEAQERAAKVGVKLVFPIFFFILPSMLVVTAGPGLLQVFKYLFPMMRQFRM